MCLPPTLKPLVLEVPYIIRCSCQCYSIGYIGSLIDSSHVISTPFRVLKKFVLFLVDNFIEREQTLIDNLLVLFSEIIGRGPLPEGEVTKESVATQCFEMKVKTQELVR